MAGVPAPAEGAPAGTTAPSGPKTLLGANAPAQDFESQPAPVRVASLTNGATPVPVSKENPSGLKFSPQVLAQVDALPSKDPATPIADKYLALAEKNASEEENPYKGPGIPRSTQEALNFENAEKAALEKANKSVDVSTKNYGEMASFLHTAGRTANHLKADLKLATAALDDKGMVFGPGANTETFVRAAKDELRDIFKRMGYEDYAKKVDNLGAHPDANQLYGKLMAGIVLQNLRNYLGPNSGQFRVFELKLLQDAFGQASMSKEANKAVLNIVDSMNDRAITINDLAYKYEKKHGLIDGSFMSAMEKMERDNPTYNPKDILGMLTSAKESPSESKPDTPTSGFKKKPPWEK